MKITVVGTPGPQGSKRHVGHGRMIESSKKVAPWREAVKWAAISAMKDRESPIVGPLAVYIEFTLQAPMKASRWPHKRPDLDKLIRSTFDALTEAGVWEDDGRVVDLYAKKVYPVRGSLGLSLPGAEITITPMS